MLIGFVIKQYLEQNNLSNSDFGLLIGWPQFTVQTWVDYKKIPSNNAVDDIASLFSEGKGTQEQIEILYTLKDLKSLDWKFRKNQLH